MPRVALITHAHYIDIDWLREDYRRFVAVGNRILFNPSRHGQDVVLGSESAFTPGPRLPPSATVVKATVFCSKVEIDWPGRIVVVGQLTLDYLYRCRGEFTSASRLRLHCHSGFELPPARD
jgi:hypothetical protein